MYICFIILLQWTFSELAMADSAYYVAMGIDIFGQGIEIRTIF